MAKQSGGQSTRNGAVVLLEESGSLSRQSLKPSAAANAKGFSLNVK